METTIFDGMGMYLAHVLGVFSAGVGFIGLLLSAPAWSTPKSTHWGVVLLLTGVAGLLIALALTW